MTVNPRRNNDCTKKGNLILSTFLSLYDRYLQSRNNPDYQFTRKLHFNYVGRIEVGDVGWCGELSPHLL